MLQIIVWHIVMALQIQLLSKEECRILSEIRFLYIFKGQFKKKVIVLLKKMMAYVRAFY